MGAPRQFSAEEFEELMQRYNLPEPERNAIRDQTPLSLRSVVRGTQNGQITNGAHVYQNVTEHLSPHGAQGLVSQQLSLWVADNWSSLAPQIVRRSENEALVFLGECLKSVTWWAVLIAVVGAIVLTAVVVGKLAAQVLAGAALGGSAVAVGGSVVALAALAPPVALVVGSMGFAWSLSNLFGNGSRDRRRRRRR